MATTFTNQAALTYNGVRTLSNVATGVMEGVLNVTKTAVRDQYAPGDTVTYVISIVNSGASAVTGLTVSDDLGAYAFGTGTVQPLSYVDGSAMYYSNGALQPAPVPDTTDGLAFNDISVPANGNAALVYSVTVNAFAPPQAGSTVTNTVTVSGTDIGEVTAQEIITAESGAQLELIKSVTPVPVAENGTLTYTIRITNSGNTAVLPEDDATVSDTFDPLLSNISVTLDGDPLAVGTGYTYDAATGVFGTVAGVLSIPAATYAQDPVTGEWSTTPGSAVLEITGTAGAMTQ